MNEATGGHGPSAVVAELLVDRGKCGNPRLPLDLLNQRVYRLGLVARRLLSVLVTRSHGVRIMPAVLSFCVCSLCLAACGASGASTSTTASTSQATKAIIKAWFAAQKAFDSAAMTSDAHSPLLAETMMSPQLDHVRENLESFASLGYRAKGTTHYSSPRVGSQDSARADLTSCVRDNEVEFVEETGKPVTGVLGRVAFEKINSVMRKTANGWKLADQTVVVDGCVGS
jgi:hypothetical protein